MGRAFRELYKKAHSVRSIREFRKAEVVLSTFIRLYKSARDRVPSPLAEGGAVRKGGGRFLEKRVVFLQLAGVQRLSSTLNTRRGNF